MDSRQRLAITRSCLTSTKLVVVLCYIYHLSPPVPHIVVLIVAMFFDVIAQVLTATLPSYSERQKFILLFTTALPTTAYISVMMIGIFEVTPSYEPSTVELRVVILAIVMVVFIRRLLAEVNRNAWYLRYIMVTLLVYLSLGVGHNKLFVVATTLLLPCCVMMVNSLPTVAIIEKTMLPALSLASTVIILIMCWESGYLNTIHVLVITALFIDLSEATLSRRC